MCIIPHHMQAIKYVSIHRQVRLSQIHLSSPQSSTTYSPQAIKHVFLIIINFSGCLHILWRVRGWDFVLCTDFLLSQFAIRNCCPNLLLEYTSTICHTFSTLESIQRSPVVIASFSPHAMKLAFPKILDANFMACMRVGSSSKFFDSSIPMHAKET